LRGIVVKSHGSADVFGFTCAIQRAAEAARQGLVSRITNQLESLAPIPA
jgi:glycerol-3-phosphate acyltransferase PlsX